MMKLLVVLVVVATLLAASLAWEADCNNIDQAAKVYVDKQIASNQVYIIGLSYCGWCKKAKDYIERMGFRKKFVVTDDVDESVTGRPDKLAIINYAYCQYSQMKTVPQVFIGKKFIGGFTDTRQYYYTGAGVNEAFRLGSIFSLFQYKWQLAYAAEDFVDEGAARSAGGKYFVLSKTRCPHCVNAKNCLKAAGVPEEDIELYEINDYETHDDIKKYKGKLTGSSYTPLLAYNGKVLRNHNELVKVTGCPPLH